MANDADEVTPVVLRKYRDERVARNAAHGYDGEESPRAVMRSTGGGKKYAGGKWKWNGSGGAAPIWDGPPRRKRAYNPFHEANVKTCIHWGTRTRYRKFTERHPWERLKPDIKSTYGGQDVHVSGYYSAVYHSESIWNYGFREILRNEKRRIPGKNKGIRRDNRLSVDQKPGRTERCMIGAMKIPYTLTCRCCAGRQRSHGKSLAHQHFFCRAPEPHDAHWDAPLRPSAIPSWLGQPPSGRSISLCI
jgi:hypothetical protein